MSPPNEMRVTVSVDGLKGLQEKLREIEAENESLRELVGTGICPRCETCLGCGAMAGPIENHDDDCPVIA